MTRWHARSLFLVLSLAQAAALADTPRPPRADPKSGGYAGLGADSLSPQEVARYAPAPLDERVSRRIQALLDVRGSGAGLTTSRGDRQIYTSRITGVDQVFRQDGPMKYPVELTGGEDRTQVVAISPDDSFAVVSRDVGGQENAGVYLLSLDGGPLRVVQHTPKIQTQLQYVTDDSKALYFRANDQDPASYAIYRYAIASGKREVVFDDKGLWSIADHRGDASWLLVKAIGSTQQEIYEYDLAARKLTPVIGQGEHEEYQVAYGARAGQILVATNKLGDFRRLYSLEAGKLTPIMAEMKHDIEGFVIDPARARIYVRSNEDGYVRLQAPSFGYDLKSVHLGHANVNQEQVSAVLLQPIHGLARIRQRGDQVSDAQQHPLAKQGDAGFVVNCQNNDRFHG